MKCPSGAYHHGSTSKPSVRDAISISLSMALSLCYLAISLFTSLIAFVFVFICATFLIWFCSHGVVISYTSDGPSGDEGEKKHLGSSNKAGKAKGMNAWLPYAIIREKKSPVALPMCLEYPFHHLLHFALHSVSPVKVFLAYGTGHSWCLMISGI